MPIETLTTYAAVKTRLNLSGTTSQDVIEQIIDGVTASFVSLCGREFVYEAGRIDYLTGNGGRVLQLSKYPIDGISEVMLAGDRDFANGDELTVDDDYRFDPENGLLIYQVGAWPIEYRGIRVTYDAGYVHPDDTPGDKAALPHDLIEAAIQQAIAWYKRRMDYATKGEKAGDGAVTFTETDLLPSVKGVLARYLRYVV